MKVRITGPQRVRGEITAPRSKAYTHRAFLASLLTQGESTIENPLRCDDTNTTRQAIEALGAGVRVAKERVRIFGVGNAMAPARRLDCDESGATLRLLTAVLSTGPYKTTLTCLSGRPILPLTKALEALGASTEIQPMGAGFSVTVKGPLKGGSARISGDVSSQFISGLLFAAPLAKSDVKIVVEGRIESLPYVKMTLAVLNKHGISVVFQGNEFQVQAPQEYKPALHQVPGDFSSIAFLLAAAGTAGEEVAVRDMNGSSSDLEPDSVIMKLLPEIGVQARQEAGRILAARGRIRGFQFDASDHPDLVPVLEVLACQAEGRSEISGVRRLVHKESNRLRSVPGELEKLGAKILIEEDRVLIEGGRELVGNELSSHHDHRVAMACAIASLAARGTTLINDAGVVSKSYPQFFDDIAKLGVHLIVE